MSLCTKSLSRRKEISAAAIATAILFAFAAFFPAPKVMAEGAPAPAISPGPPPFPPMFTEPAVFLDAIAKERPLVPPTTRLTGISVPHHLLAADLIARGFWSASASQPDRVIVMSPDHFHKSTHLFTTSRRTFCTVFGCLSPDREAVAALLKNADLVNESDLFAGEHGIAAILPFVAHFFPNAKIVPLVISVDSHRGDWDRMVAILRPLIGGHTLIVQSTDFSHYLPLGASLLRDQETLNVLAARDSDAVSGLHQSDHIDSKAAQYIQLRLQAALNAVGPIVVASRNAYEYRPVGGATTYMVELFAPAEPPAQEVRYGDQDTYYFGGDVLLGRYLTKALTHDASRAAMLAEIRKATGGGKLVVNLEGFVLNEQPVGIAPDAHLMYEDVAIAFLKDMNVVAAGLANNHSYDLGQIGLDETVAALKRGGILPIRHGEIADLGSLRLLALNFISKNTIPGYPTVRAGDLARICAQQARPPLIAFVHWGTEYTTAAAAPQSAQTSQLGDCGVSAVIGVHSHRASAGITDIAGGAQQMTYSLGNLLFDQNGTIGSGALLELRVFKQGTFASRLIPMRNLFDLGNAVLARQVSSPGANSDGTAADRPDESAPAFHPPAVPPQ